MTSTSTKNNSFLYADNVEFIEGIYQRYLRGDRSIGKEWYDFFTNDTEINQKDAESLQLSLANFFRTYGHFFADLNPLVTNGGQSINYIKYSGINLKDTANEFVSQLRQIYCKNIGFEFMHISSYEERKWLQDKIENQNNHLSVQDKKEILRHLIESEVFEQFLHVKFPGYKRFSIEGGETAIVALEKIINDSCDFGIEEIIFGMAHRGRLNVLTKVIGKEYAAVLSEFRGDALCDDPSISGDVKYHLGYFATRIIAQDKKICLNLCYNPSHLEAVNPVLAGRVKAKQETSSVLGVLIHGDAAFIGQGVVAEALSFSNIQGYQVGGIVHIVINNQIGFTTNSYRTRSSFYCTDVVKLIEVPVFHVNGDDPEAVSFVTSLAMEYRQMFKKDVVIDIVCYRKYGHNEGDEPYFTQPLMYKLISEHKSSGKVYEEKLIADGIINSEEVTELHNKFRIKLDKDLKTEIVTRKTNCIWSSSMEVKPNKYFGLTKNKLKNLGIRINSNVPDNFNIHSKVKKIVDHRLDSMNSESNIDWSTAESLAFGSLLIEGIKVRLSGQDCCRGTFSQRHAKLIDQATEAEFIPLNNIDADQALIEVINSSLSEYAVMGFEYGYSLDSPNVLVLWEAQFGDFANGGQIIIDQFIASAETKWSCASGLVLLLPHGYEGQGPEHSSARIERFLQLCAEDNMQVVNCSTPANYFHVLRRQIHRGFRKPLIIFTPKSLLRHKKAVSNLSDFEGSFLTVIPEYRKNLVSNDKIRKVIICSGKIYYDIIEVFESKAINDIAVVRLEQFYPFPMDKLAHELDQYKNAEVVWCQEEPKNMGGWFFINPLVEELLSNLSIYSKRLSCIARPASASTACGCSNIHSKQQIHILSQVVDTQDPSC